ncbi:MAG TPA: hypothetical protein VH206_01120 [Xanthobacteraceae bacterium]|nr:hypothetical protein [Xanthobacteraceae bacterium]
MAWALSAALASALGGCADLDIDKGGQVWFQKPLDVGGKNAGGYTFSELAETKQHRRTIAPNDLVNANGTCPTLAEAAPPSPAPQANGQPPAPASVSTSALLGGGVALGMSECDVVFRAGAPSSVQIGQNPNGDRTAVLTFNGGPRAGIYRFERGSLMAMDRVAQSALPPTPKAAAKPQKKTNPS